MVLHGRGFQIKRAADFAAGGIAVGMQHAVAAVRAFAGKGDLGAGAVELGAPLDQLFDAGRTFLDQHARGLFVAQAVAGLQGVFQMQADFIVVAERGGDSALRVLRVGFGDFALGQAEHASGGGKLHRGAQTGNARAHHDEIGFGRQCLHARKVHH